MADIRYLNPGSSCWAVFLKMGALRENSPNGFVVVSMNSQTVYLCTTNKAYFT